jgi:hypothetical protein
MLFLFGNSPAGHGFYDPAGVLPLLFSSFNTLFYSQHVLKLPCTGMLYYIFYAGQVDGDAHIKDDKAG